MPLMLAYWALREPQLPALVPAFLLGLMLDVLYAAPLGQHALGLVVVVYLVVRLRSFFIIFPLWQATVALVPAWVLRSEEHTSELQSLMRISYAVFCLKKKKLTKKTMTQ